MFFADKRDTERRNKKREINGCIYEYKEFLLLYYSMENKLQLLVDGENSSQWRFIPRTWIPRWRTSIFQQLPDNYQREPVNNCGLQPIAMAKVCLRSQAIREQRSKKIDCITINFEKHCSIPFLQWISKRQKERHCDVALQQRMNKTLLSPAP